jgi:hypothetical protein
MRNTYEFIIKQNHHEDEIPLEKALLYAYEGIVNDLSIKAGN